jgi:3-phenylpropionate/trans-cinnamate dioxygenase ferredoxin subunit
MTYVAVANLSDLEVGDTMLVDELREPICLIRLDDDDVRAIHNTCTHQQQPLHEGTLQDDDTLVCAAHLPADPSRFTHARSKTTPFSSTLTSS